MALESLGTTAIDVHVLLYMFYPFKYLLSRTVKHYYYSDVCMHNSKQIVKVKKTKKKCNELVFKMRK